MIEMEIGFNILYLLTIYLFVALMIFRSRSTKFTNKPGSTALLWAFLLLAIGDTGHVGFRLLAFAKGGLEANEVLVGLGALATSITITFFYMLMMEVWRKQTDQSRCLFFWLVMILGVGRLVFLTLPENNWGQVVPPFEFSLIRNSFLTVMGIIVAVFFLKDGVKKNRFLILIGIAVVCSFTFYIPVILFVQKMPMIGMLMIPKTLAYIYMAWIGYKMIFPKE